MVKGREKPSMPIRGCMSACPVEIVMTAKMVTEAVRVATAMASSWPAQVKSWPSSETTAEKVSTAIVLDSANCTVLKASFRPRWRR
jgi:hypothetical protein